MQAIPQQDSGMLRLLGGYVRTAHGWYTPPAKGMIPMLRVGAPGANTIERGEHSFPTFATPKSTSSNSGASEAGSLLTRDNRQSHTPPRKQKKLQGQSKSDFHWKDFWYHLTVEVLGNIVASLVLITALAVFGALHAVKQGLHSWSTWAPDRLWLTPSTIIAVVTFCIVCRVFIAWRRGRLTRVGFLKTTRRWTIVGLAALGITGGMRIDIINKIWNLVTAHPWLTSTILLTIVLLITTLALQTRGTQRKDRARLHRRHDESRSLRLVS